MHLHLFKESIQKPGESRDGCGRIEITIAAFAEAKGNVNIEARYQVYWVTWVAWVH
jgi:hypothetical protein